MPAPEPSAATSTPSPRLEWVDAARGTAIVLIVLYHASLYALAADSTPSAWHQLGELLGLFALPTFFFVSGMLSASNLTRSWSLVLRRRVAPLLALYVVWVTITVVFFNLVPNTRAPGYARGMDVVDALDLAFLRPSTGLWYLLALVIFLTVARAGRRVPAAWQVGFAFVLSAGLVVFNPIQNGPFVWRYMAMFFPFFVLGCHGRGLADTVVQRLSIDRTVALLIAYVLLAGAGLTFLPADFPRPGLHLVGGSLGLLGGLGLAAAVTRSKLSSAVVRLGRNTLPVYVTHEMLVGGLSAAWAAWAGNGLRNATGPVLPFLLTVATVPLAVAVYRLLRRNPVLFGPRLPPRAERPAVQVAPEPVTTLPGVDPTAEDVELAPDPSVVLGPILDVKGEQTAPQPVARTRPLCLRNGSFH